MKANSLCRILLGASAMVLLGGMSVLATDEHEVDSSISSQVDIIAPVFSKDTQKRYVVKRVDDGEFVPDDVITGIKATDNVDGNDVKIQMVQHNVDLTRDGIYQVLYTATDKSGNSSALCVEVIVDGIAPTFNESIEKLYYINHLGVISDSKNNVVDKLPEMITATDAVGAYAGIGVYMTDMNGNIVCVDKVKDSPAEKILEVNDILVSIDGEDVRGKTAAYAASRIKGQEGSVVRLGIIRDNVELTVDVERMIIKIYGDEDCIAEPDVDITDIDFQNDGVIEITYTATDQAGNTATFVLEVVIGDTDVEAIVDKHDDIDDSEETQDDDTSGNPPTPPTDLEEETIVEIEETNKID